MAMASLVSHEVRRGLLVRVGCCYGKRTGHFWRPIPSVPTHFVPVLDRQHESWQKTAAVLAANDPA